MERLLAGRFRWWFEHEKDAHARVLQSLQSVPVDRRSGPEYQKSLSILAHVAGARKVWLVRLGVMEGQVTLTPKDVTLAEVQEALNTINARWSEFLAQITDQDLNRVFEYQSFDGGRFRNRIEDVLTQLVGHSSYHRGQIAMLVKAAGGEPAITDLIYWCREKVEG